MTRLKKMPSPAADALEWKTQNARRIPRRERLINALLAAREEPIRLQIEGGRAFGHELRELVSRGYLVMRSLRYYGVHPSTNASYSDHRLFHRDPRPYGQGSGCVGEAKALRP